MDKRHHLEEATLDDCVDHWIATANAAIDDHGFFAVALSGGNTPKTIYQRLVLPDNAKKVDWENVHLFWSDERTVPPDDPDSNYRMAMDAGFETLPIPPGQIHRMEAEKELAASAENYEEIIREVVPSASLDLIMLGMGDDGHTASLFPGTEALKIKDRLVVPNHVPQKDCWRMTFTFPMINQAKQIVVYVMGDGKREMLEQVFKDPEKYPAGQVGTEQSPALWLYIS